jgi:hypothetical protein
MSFSALVEWAVVVWVAATAVGFSNGSILLARESRQAASKEPETETQAVQEGSDFRASHRWVDAIEFYE